MRALIADDHAVVREGVKRILMDAFGGMVFGDAATAQEAIDRIWQSEWDLVLLDISMPGRGGLEVLAEVRKAWPSLPVLVLSMHPEDQFAIRILKSGASGYLTKESAPDLLVDAVKKVLSGRRFVSPSLGEQMASHLDLDSGRPLHEQLSNREFQVLRLIALGRTATEIATELSLSVKTISTYRVRILEKLGMRTTAELIHYAVRNRLSD